MTELSDDKKGGIAWGGSLVGSENPNNLGYRYSTATKRYRVVEDTPTSLPSNLQIQFQNREGKELAGILDVPTNSSVDDLNALVHALLEADDKRIPYAFYAKINGDDVGVTDILSELFEHFPDLSTESVLQLTYQPRAVFRVRPVTRCSDTLPGHTEAILHVSYAPHGRLLASGGGDTMVRFWDILTATPKFTCAGHKNHICLGDRNGVWILWDPSKGVAIGKHVKAHKQWITGLAWEPLHANSKCERLATSSKDGTLKVWNVRTQSCLVTLSGHTDSVEAVKWGESVYSASRDRTIKVWNPDRGILVRTLTGHGHRINTLALSSDYVNRVGPFDHKNTKFESEEAAFKAAKEKYEEFKRNQGGVERLVSGSDDFTLFLWHPQESKQPIKRLTGHQQAVNQIVFSPDARYFASASFDKKVKIWNGFSGDFISTLTGHVGAVYQVAWSADSRYLVSASKDSTAKLWEVPSGKRAKGTLPGHFDEVYALDWSPTGGSVATGSKDRTIKIWKH